MGFLSFKFILFIAVTFFMFFVVPKKYQWIVLLLFSYFYYYLCSHKLIIILFVDTLFVYLSGRCLSYFNNRIKETGNKEIKEKLLKERKAVLCISITLTLGILIVLKYGNFIIENINYAINGNLSLFDFILPIGLSFYTLQAISYLVDVSKGKCKCEKNLFHFMLFMSFFPQIIQGPIPRYKKLANQLFEEHNYDYTRVAHGIQLMLWGIAKKAIIADRIGIPVRYFFSNYGYFHGFASLLGAICYGFQIYTDFSGGIDAIKGISEVFGIYLDDNFHQPFFSKSVEEFWRRWHITLGAWMKDYVFYPLSLSKTFNKLGRKARKKFGDKVGKKLAPCLAMFIVYFLVGLWHGAEWKYVVYGIWNGLFIMSGIFFENDYKIIINRLKIDPDAKWFNVFRILRTFLICSIGRIISRSENVLSALQLIRSIFRGFFDISYITPELIAELGLNLKNWVLILIMIFIVMYIDYLKEKGIKIRESIDNKNIFIRWSLYFALVLSILVFGLYGGEYDASAFIYGKF